MKFMFDLTGYNRNIVENGVKHQTINQLISLQAYMKNVPFYIGRRKTQTEDTPKEKMHLVQTSTSSSILSSYYFTFFSQMI